MSAMSRSIFSESEKACLKELVVKYELNLTSTIRHLNPTIKRFKWHSLTEEFNCIDTNSKRTEAQLRKCWDNMKTRQKHELILEKRDRIKKHFKYNRVEEREEELHRLKVAEKEWLVKAAKEYFLKAQLERENAEEELQYNRDKRNLTEIKPEI